MKVKPSIPKGTVVLAIRGVEPKEVPLKGLTIPDCWHIIEFIREKGWEAEAQKLLETWHLAHDLKENLAVLYGIAIEAEPETRPYRYQVLQDEDDQ